MAVAGEKPMAVDKAAACVALDPTEWSENSDHSPIVATFEN
jgi:hypothetical protein